MKPILLGLLCGMSLALAAFTAAAATAPHASATLYDAKGAKVGAAELTQTPTGVEILINAEKLPPGERAVHIHEAGKCDGADGFKSAGAHFNPTHKEHGRLNPQGQHGGDMDNQKVDDNGMLKVKIINPNVTMNFGATSLFDTDGSSIVIHAGADDYKSQPAGNAGDRIACGIIQRK